MKRKLTGANQGKKGKSKAAIVLPEPEDGEELLTAHQVGQFMAEKENTIN